MSQTAYTLEQALREILILRQENGILRAQVDVVRAFQGAINAPSPLFNSGQPQSQEVDITYHLQKMIEEAKQPVEVPAPPQDVAEIPREPVHAEREAL